MRLEQIAGLILEWWRSGDRTSQRMASITAHFGEQYGLSASEREHIAAILRCWQVSREGW